MPFYVIAGDYSKSIHHFLKGYRSDLQGDLDEAIENYRSALLYNQKSSSLMSELSFAYIKRGELNKAESILNEAIKLDESNRNALILLGGIYSAKGDIEKAKICIKNVLF